jgi:hypothetical protein
MATSFADIEADARREDRRRELWSRWRHRILVIVGTLMAIAFVLWANWFLQRNVILGDDTARGERFGAALRSASAQANNRVDITDQCKAAAEAFYGHGILGSEPGYAPPNEKAFFVACSGVTVGGHGGGQGD